MTLLVSCLRSTRALLAAVLFLAVAPSLPAQEFLTPEAQKEYEQGKALLDEKKYDEAAVVLGKARLLNPQNPRIHLALGQAYLKLGEFEAAKNEFVAVTGRADEFGLLEDVPADVLAAAYNGRGEVLLEQPVAGAVSAEQPLALAAQHFGKAVALDQTNKDYLLNQGLAYLRLRDAAQAIRAMDRAIALDADFAEAYDVRGRAYGIAGDYEQAEADLVKASQLKPEDGAFPYSLGVVRLQRGAYQAAIDAFNTAVKNDPQGEDLNARLGLASAEIELGRSASAGEARRQAYRAAIDAANDAIQIDPRSALAYYNRGVAERYLDEYPEAIRSFTRAVQLDPDLGEAYFRRGIAWYYLDEPAVALADFDEATRRNLREVHEHIPYMWEGFAFAKQGKYYDAINAYSEAIEKDDRYAPAYNNRGLAYLHVGRYEKALDNFDQLLRLEPGQPTTYYKRAVAYGLLGRYDEAAASYRKALHLDPNYTAAQQGLADVKERRP